MSYSSKILLFLVFCTTLGACKKQLNVFPTTSEVDGNVITDDNSAVAALQGVYYCFANSGADYNGIPTTQWYSLFQNYSSELSGMQNYPHGGGGLSEYVITPEDFPAAAYWSYGYKLVNAANGFIKNVTPVENIVPATKQQMVGAARFLRAFGNATLLLYFGQYDDPSSTYGIILREEFVSSGNINLPRATVAESYNSILSDLDIAIASLPEQASQKYLADQWTAKLLKARVLINRGQGDDYTQVISLTNDIITHGPYTLEDNVKDIFLSKALSSNEVMLGIQPFPKQTTVYDNYLYYNQEVATPLMMSLFENDPRSTWMIQTIPDSYTGDPIGAIIKYYPGSAAAPVFNAITENGYAFRLTEAYLLEAEAITKSGGNLEDAKTLLKTVLNHAGVTDFSQVDNESTAEGLELLVIKEEMRNFVSEGGEDWLAIRRLPFATLQSLMPIVQNKNQLVMPIPQTEITANDKIEQNPGY